MYLVFVKSEINLLLTCCWPGVFCHAFCIWFLVIGKWYIWYLVKFRKILCKCKSETNLTGWWRQVREGLTECWAAVRDKVEFAENGETYFYHDHDHDQHEYEINYDDYDDKDDDDDDWRSVLCVLFIAFLHIY